MLELLGFIGGLLFGCACVPMAWKAWRTGNHGTTPDSAIWLFFSACITYFGYLFLRFGFHFAFCIGIVETLCWLVVIRYRYFPRNSAPVKQHPLDECYSLCLCGPDGRHPSCPVHRTGEP